MKFAFGSNVLLSYNNLDPLEFIHSTDSSPNYSQYNLAAIPHDTLTALFTLAFRLGFSYIVTIAVQMRSISPHYLLVLSTGILPCTAAWGDFRGFNGYFPSPLFSSSTPLQALEKRALNLQLESGVNYNPNGTMFLWLPEDEYAGKTFFE